METLSVSGRELLRHSLETFLRGMETSVPSPPSAARARLETFLRGMETELHHVARRRRPLP